MDVVEHVEGRTKLLVPLASLKSRGPPPKNPAFFNPLASVTRDFAVLFYAARSAQAQSKIRLLDALAGVGARGIRVANESSTSIDVHLNDANPAAADLARRNCEINGISDRCEVSVEDANVLMYSAPRRGERFDAIDVDPFGSPVPFVEAALSTVRLGGVAAFTATDLSALTGKSRASGLRKYYVDLSPTDFPHEVAARALAGYLVIRAASRERGARPLFAHVDSQYVRVYVEVRGSARAADESLRGIGYLEYCPRCLYRGIRAADERGRTCPYCGGKLQILGPLWLGDLFDRGLLEAMLRESESRGWSGRSKVLSRMLQEVGLPPYYYSLDSIADALGICVPRVDSVVEELRSLGYKAARSGIYGLGVRTDAPHGEVIEAVRRLSPCGPPPEPKGDHV